MIMLMILKYINKHKNIVWLAVIMYWNKMKGSAGMGCNNGA